MWDTRCDISRGGRALLTGVPVARTFSRRLIGMAAGAGRRESAMLFPRCGAVHMMWMDRALDIVALGSERDGKREVIGVDTVAPWGRVPRHRGCSAILECEAGTCERLGIGTGDMLVISRNESAPGTARPRRLR